MTYIWFNSVLESMGKFINYESISNLYGNSFAKDAAKLIQAANPLIKHGKAQNGLASVWGHIHMNTVKTEKDEQETTAQILGDMSWIMRGEGD